MRHGCNRILKIFDYKVYIALIGCRRASTIAHTDDGRRGVGGQRLVRGDFSGGKGGFDGGGKCCPDIYLVRVKKCLEVGNGRRAFFCVSETDVSEVYGHTAYYFKVCRKTEMRAEYSLHVDAFERRVIAVSQL